MKKRLKKLKNGIIILVLISERGKQFSDGKGWNDGTSRG
jgi:hypothetical protein